MTAAPADTKTHRWPAAVAGRDDELTACLEEQRLVAQRALRSVLGFCTDEEDLIQEVLTRLVVRLRQPGDVAVGAWTWRVAHNVAVDHLRARRATPMDPALLDREIGDGLDDHVIASELAAVLNDGLARLPDRQREALVAQAALDGGRGSHALVATELGVSRKAAESILARARHALRRELDRAGVREGTWVAIGAALRPVRGAVRWARRRARLIAPPGSVAIRATTIAAVTLAASGLVLLGPSNVSGPAAPAPRSSASTTAPSPARDLAPAKPGRPAGAAPGGAVSTVVTLPSLMSVPTLPSPPPVTAPTVPPVTITVPASATTTLPTVPRLPQVTLPSPLRPALP